eukprot:806827-Pleurochrysis_carterae.AAC.1
MSVWGLGGKGHLEARRAPVGRSARRSWKSEQGRLAVGVPSLREPRPKPVATAPPRPMHVRSRRTTPRRSSAMYGARSTLAAASARVGTAPLLSTCAFNVLSVDAPSRRSSLRATHGSCSHSMRINCSRDGSE